MNVTFIRQVIFLRSSHIIFIANGIAVFVKIINYKKIFIICIDYTLGLWIMSYLTRILGLNVRTITAEIFETI